MKKIISAPVLLMSMGIFIACNNSGQHNGSDTTGTSDTGFTLNGGSSIMQSF